MSAAHRAAPFVPSHREAWLAAGSVFLLALVVRAVAAASLSFPVPEDTAYYADVARNLVNGRSLTSDALWSYQTQPLVVPRAAFEVWLPLPSLLAAIPMAIAGAGNWFRAAQVFSVVAGAIGAVLAWRLGADVAMELRLPPGRARTLAVGSGLVACFLGPLVVYGALPDSTALFADLSLAAGLLMTRLRPGSRRGLAGLGLILGLAALTRSEAIWLGLAWAVAAWFWLRNPDGSRPPARERLILVAVPALVAAIVFVPWAIRDWLVFGSPLPGQTLANALSIKPTDIFAYQDQPTLARYLAQGPAALAGLRVDGLAHNLLIVIMLPAFPVGLIGLIALPWTGRLQSLRPLLLFALITFTIDSLVFPVSTTWGTFLHSAGAIYVLLIVSCLVGLDAFIAWIGRIRHWWRPVAWLGPALATAVCVPLLAVSVVSLDRAADDTRSHFDALGPALSRAGISLPNDAPVITDNPIWLAQTQHVPALALPEESPDSVLALARQFGARLVVVTGITPDRLWPDVLLEGDSAANCFSEVKLTDNSGSQPSETSPLHQIRVFRIVCP